jgi:hypothetical protein
MASPSTKLPPPPKKAATEPETTRQFAITSGRLDRPQRVVLYGPGGIGKTTLASLAPGAVVIDIEDGSTHLDLRRIGDGVGSLDNLRALLRSDTLDGVGTVVIDSATRAEELAIEWTLEHVKHEKGHKVSRTEDYGFGKCMQHTYETFLLLLADLDAQIRKGRNVILVAHDCVESVPNPVGEDWIRYEPHLQAPRSGKASIRNRVFQWADHVLFLGYDVLATKDGKGRGSGTRTIYPKELPTHRAKSRLIEDPMPFNDPTDDSIWKLLLPGGGK